MIIHPADRLGLIEEYYFSRKLREIARIKAEGKPIINLGIGSPDLLPPKPVIDTLINQVKQPAVHGYQPYQGIPELREAIASFSLKRMSIQLSSEEILPLIGSKEGITHLSMAYLNPGDQVLIPAIGYPTYSSVTKMVGATPVYYPLLESQNWEPDWDFFHKLDFSKVKLIWINYPHMPTGTAGSTEILLRFIELAKQHKVLICHDNPYGFINGHPQSILELPGGKEVAVEFNSLSKTFNMAGGRVGWVGGNREYIEPITKIKSNMDSGMFRPIQEAACIALSIEDEWYENLNRVYRDRREVVCQILDQLRCSYQKDQRGLFMWAKVPTGDGAAFMESLLMEKNIFVAPGFIFGDAGKSFIRISLCSPVEQLNEVLRRVS